MIRLGILAFGTVLWVAGCFGHRGLELVDPPLGGSMGGLEVRASISDTVFAASDLRNYSTVRFEPPPVRAYANPYNVDLSQFKGPRATFTLYNRSTRAYMVPTGDLQVFLDNASDIYTGVGVNLYHDSLGMLLPGIPAGNFCEEYDFTFSLLKPNDSIQFSEPIDVLMYYVHDIEHIHRDKYTLQLSYNSHCIPPGDTSIWIGRIESEPLEFWIK